MNRLVSVGGLCFVAGTPENTANLSDRSDRSDGSDIAGSEGAVLASGTGKRKYRAAHREEIARYNREYYLSNREEISRKAHLAYLRRKERNEPLQRMP